MKERQAPELRLLLFQLAHSILVLRPLVFHLALEVDELDEAEVGLMTTFGAVTAPLVSQEELLAAGELLPAGGAALMVVWENTWANTLLGAIGRAGGEIIVSQRLAHADVLAALEA